MASEGFRLVDNMAAGRQTGILKQAPKDESLPPACGRSMDMKPDLGRVDVGLVGCLAYLEPRA